jgi:hypothetical protein
MAPARPQVILLILGLSAIAVVAMALSYKDVAMGAVIAMAGAMSELVKKD